MSKKPKSVPGNGLKAKTAPAPGKKPSPVGKAVAPGRPAQTPKPRKGPGFDTGTSNCDCESLFAGHAAGIAYWDGDTMQNLEMPTSGGPWGLQVVNGELVWVNLS